MSATTSGPALKSGGHLGGHFFSPGLIVSAVFEPEADTKDTWDASGGDKGKLGSQSV